MISYPAKFHRQQGGYWVEFPDVPGCLTEGDTIEEAKRMAREALTGILEVRLEYDEPIRKPSRLKGRSIHWIEPEIQVGVALTLRWIRKKQGKTMKDLAKRMGVSVGEIQRLEDPKRSNPTVRKLSQICEALDLHVSDFFSRRAA